MNEYHINPATGDVSRCRAKHKCPFGGASGKENHYLDHKQAVLAAENISQQIALKDTRKRQLKEAYQRYGENIFPFNMEFSDDVNHLLSTLRSHGFRPLLAGGAVRDAVTNENSRNSGSLEIDSKDLDFEIYLEDPQNTSVNNDNATKKLVEAGRNVGNVDEVGKSFGVLKMTLNDGTEIDLSLPRKESKTGAGHTGFDVRPDINMNVKEASARRDFTLNSMMYDDDRKVIVDPHNGLEDLKKKRLRHTSDAFAEDPLRVLRSFQFASRFGLNLDKDTIRFSQDLFSEYDTISEERIQTEWDKWASKGKKPSSGLQVLHDTGWEKGFSGLSEANHENTRTSVDKAAELCDADSSLDRTVIVPSVVIANIKDEDKNNQLEKRRKFASKAIIGVRSQRLALALADSSDDGYKGVSIEAVSSPSAAKQAALDTRMTLRERMALHKALSASAGSDNNADHLSRAEQSIHDADVWDQTEPELVNGNDLLSLTDRKAGPWMAETIRHLRLAQAQEKFSTKDEGRQYAQNLLADQ